MAEFITKDGDLVRLEGKEAEEASRSPDFKLLPGSVGVSSTGATLTGDPKVIQKDIASGNLRPETSAESARRARETFREEEFGGIGGALGATAGSFASGASLGISDDLAVAFGVDPETIAGQREQFPILSTGANIAGIGAAALATGGTTGAVTGVGKAGGLLARGLRTAPTGLLFRGTGALTKAAAGRGTAARLAAGTVGAGIEGSLLNTAAYRNEVLLGDKELSAEGLLASLKEGGLAGGGIGLGFGLLGAAARGVKGSGSKLLKDSEAFAKRADEAELDTALKKVFPKRDLSPAGIEKARDKLVRTLDDQEAQVSRLFTAVDEQIAQRGALETQALSRSADRLRASRARAAEFQASLRTQRPAGEVPGGVSGLLGRPAARAARGRVVQRADVTQLPGGVTRAAPDDVATFREGVEAISGLERAKFETTEEFLRLVQGAPASPGAAARIQTIAQDATAFRDAAARQSAGNLSAETLLNQVAPGVPAAGAGAAGAQAARGGSAANILGAAAAGVAAEAVAGDIPVIGPALASFLAFRSRIGRIGRVGRLLSRATGGPGVAIAERVTSVRNQVNDAIASAVKGTTKVVRPGAVPVSVTLGRKLFDAGDEPVRRLPSITGTSERAKSLSAFNARLSELEQANANPELVKDSIAAQIPTGDEALLSAIEDVALRKFAFLKSKAPEDPTTPGIYETDWQPSDIQLEEFAELVTAVDAPADSIEAMLTGGANPNIAEAIREVYPRLYQEAEEALLDNIIETRETQPFDRRIELSMMFEDVAGDETVKPQLLSMIQAVFQEEEAIQEPQQPGPPQSSLANNVNAAERESLKTTRISGTG